VIGLGTYAFFWQHSELVAKPLDLFGMLARTRELDVDLFQICDYPVIESFSDAELDRLAATARDLGVALELGTRGISAQHLQAYARLATRLDVTLVRSMINTATERPTLLEAQASLRSALPTLEGAGVTVALETYEQVSSTDLVALIENVASENVGICLDPANSVAALENPRDVIDRTAPYVRNIHVKDFAFTRRGGWVGFTLEGVPLGTGLLDYDYLIETVKPHERGINQIVEHWLPLGDTIDETVRLEDEWNTHNLRVLRARSLEQKELPA
jgi:sugar phosphate isomerase/epimerase